MGVCGKNCLVFVGIANQFIRIDSVDCTPLSCNWEREPYSCFFSINTNLSFLSQPGPYLPTGQRTHENVLNLSRYSIPYGLQRSQPVCLYVDMNSLNASRSTDIATPHFADISFAFKRPHCFTGMLSLTWRRVCVTSLFDC